MPALKVIEVKESLAELKNYCKGKSFTVQKRIQMLLAIKKDTKGLVSKRKLSAIIGVNHTSITDWKKLYETQGIQGLLTDGRIGFKQSLISAENHDKIKEKLTNPSNNLHGYKELQDWILEELSQDLKYITVLKYAQRHFDTKIKVARKSHIKKDEKSVGDFKKNLQVKVKN